MKKRILHLLSTDKYSGAENVACQIIGLFADEKNIEMLYCSPDGPIRDVVVARNIRFLPIKKMDIKSLKEILRNEHIDIVHAHDIRASVLAAMAVREHDNIKVISHIHGNHYSMKKVTAKSLLYGLFSGRFSHIFWVSRSCLNNFAFKKKIIQKSSVLPNVIDNSAVISKARFAEEKTPYDVVFIGRLVEAKDPLRVLKIMKEAAMVNPAIKCAIIGAGEYYDAVKQEIIDEGLEENIKLLGSMENPYGILKNAKVFLMASRHEGLPMVVLEALALGVPIVSTPTDGVSEIANDDNAIFLSQNDERLVEKILSYVDKGRDKSVDESKRLLRNKESLENYKKKLSRVYCACGGEMPKAEDA